MNIRERISTALVPVAAVLVAGVLAAWSPLADGHADVLQEAEVYRGTLGAIDDSGVQGEVVVQRKGEQLSVRVNANGLSSGAHGQHIHEGETCESIGGIAVPLDNSLGTVEEGFGGEFPTTEGESGTLTYNQKGSNSAFADLDLANATVVVHAGVPGAPVACAALDKKGK